MKEGTYTIESIENNLVKLLYRQDESNEVLLPLSTFDFSVKEGDLISIEMVEGKMHLTSLEKETADVKAYVKSLREELLNREQK